MLVLSGCAVGPDFKPPAAPTTDGYTAEKLPVATVATDVPGGEAQHFQLGRELPGQWWVLFGSTELNRLIEEAVTSYPGIAAQQAALRAARENVRAQQGVFLPQIAGDAGWTRERSSGAAIAPGFPGFITNIYLATVNVSYAIDVFGGERRTIEGLQAQAEAQSLQLEASYLTLMANVAASAIQLASVRDQIEVTHEIIALEEKQLAVIHRQFELGSRTQADVLQQQSNLATVRASLPALQQQLAAAEHQLAILTGRFPPDADPIRLQLSDLVLPQELPLQAFQNVADTLTALDNDAQALNSQADAVNAAKAGLALIQRQYDAGAVDYVSLLTAEQSYNQARIAYVRAIASRYTDTVTLFQALGGGWWKRSDPGTLPSSASRGTSMADPLARH